MGGKKDPKLPVALRLVTLSEYKGKNDIGSVYLHLKVWFKLLSSRTNFQLEDKFLDTSEP